MTSEQIQQWIRIVIYAIAGAVVQHGFANEAVAQQAAGFAVLLANGAWTVYGNRFVARLNELVKSGQVKGVVTTPEMAQATPSDKIVASVQDLPPAAKLPQ